MAKTELTKQGVRNLDTQGKNSSVHQHKFVPTTTKLRSGLQVTQMQCFCGYVEVESQAEAFKRARMEAEVNADEWENARSVR